MNALEKETLLYQVAAQLQLRSNQDYLVSYQGDALYIRCASRTTAEFFAQRLPRQLPGSSTSPIENRQSVQHPFLLVWQEDT